MELSYLQKYYIDPSEYDVVIGFRADDSYFDYAESFLNNGISVEQLAQAMRLGKLGEQIVIKSKFAFSKLKYEGFDVDEMQKALGIYKVNNSNSILS